jgi:hypothetical protein
LRLHDPARYRRAGTGAVPISLERSVPWVEVSIATADRREVAGRLLLDTGYSGALWLAPDFTDANRLLDTIAVLKPAGTAGLGGHARVVAGQLEQLRIGTSTVDHPMAYFARERVGVAADPDFRGAIGEEALQHFVVVLDYAGGRMWLDPPS